MKHFVVVMSRRESWSWKGDLKYIFPAIWPISNFWLKSTFPGAVQTFPISSRNVLVQGTFIGKQLIRS